MSRRRGEFEHRTSIFEGAFRAWSYLGGLDPLELESKSLAELDPLNAKAEERAKDDPRLAAAEYKKQKADNVKLSKKENDASLATRRIYPYEPLPRSGLAHPFVQAILSPWLGPEAEQNAIQLGLTTLRTWWQHRRKGESGSAVQALGTDKMRGVVEGYTRHFFSLAYCLVTNDGEQPPRTLATKMKELEKVRQKKHKRKSREDEAGKNAALALNAGIASGLGPGLGPENDGEDGDDSEDEGDDEDAATGAGGENSSSLVPGMMNIGGFAKSAVGGSGADGEPDAADVKNMSDLERRFALKQSQIKPLNPQQQALQQALQPAINMKGKCIPGKLDLQQLALQMQAHGTQSMHMGGGGAYSGVVTPDMAGSANLAKKAEAEEFDGKTPIVFISPTTGDIQIAMSVDGITCAHCVKIVETVLKGCNGNKSPIEGLLDAAADHDLCSVIIKIDKASNAKRIAKESSRNLAMVGYTAKVMEMTIDLNNSQRGNGQKIDVGLLNSAFDVVAATDPSEVFDWTLPCTCPDNGVLRKDCHRHLQMNDRIFQAFRDREKQVLQYMVGCGARYGGDCTCDPDNCQCVSCNGKCKSTRKSGVPAAPDPAKANANANHLPKKLKGKRGSSCCAKKNGGGGGKMPAAETTQGLASGAGAGGGGGGVQHMMNMTSDEVNRHLTAAAFDAFEGQGMDQGAVAPGMAQGIGNGMPRGGAVGPAMAQGNGNGMPRGGAVGPGMAQGSGNGMPHGGGPHGPAGGQSQGRSYVVGPDGRRRPSEQSEHTFGRAMSGLSALSIDWDNMDDFDVNVDHSAHITNRDVNLGQHTQQQFNAHQFQQHQLAQAQAQAHLQAVHRNSLQQSFNQFDEEESGMFSAGIMSGCAMARGGPCNCGPSCACVGCPIHDQGAASMGMPQQHLQQGGGGFNPHLADLQSLGMMRQMGNANPAMMAAMQQRMSLQSAGSHQYKRNSLN